MAFFLSTFLFWILSVEQMAADFLKNPRRITKEFQSHLFFSGQNSSIIPGALANPPSEKVPLFYARIELWFLRSEFFKKIWNRWLRLMLLLQRGIHPTMLVLGLISSFIDRNSSSFLELDDFGYYVSSERIPLHCVRIDFSFITTGMETLKPLRLIW